MNILHTIMNWHTYEQQVLGSYQKLCSFISSLHCAIDTRYWYQLNLMKKTQCLQHIYQLTNECFKCLCKFIQKSSNCFNTFCYRKYLKQIIFDESTPDNGLILISGCHNYGVGYDGRFLKLIWTRGKYFICWGALDQVNERFHADRAVVAWR